MQKGWLGDDIMGLPDRRARHEAATRALDEGRGWCEALKRIALALERLVRAAREKARRGQRPVVHYKILCPKGHHRSRFLVDVLASFLKDRGFSVGIRLWHLRRLFDGYGNPVRYREDLWMPQRGVLRRCALSHRQAESAQRLDA